MSDNNVNFVALDDVDRKILNEVVRNGRASYKQLGQVARLSPHAVAPRLRRMVDAGIVKGFTAVVDYGAIGRGLEALVDIRLLSTTDPDSFEEAASKLRPTRELTFLTGRFDYQLRASCLDADDLDQMVRALRAAGAAVTETRIALRTRSFRHAVV